MKTFKLVAAIILSSVLFSSVALAQTNLSATATLPAGTVQVTVSRVEENPPGNIIAFDPGFTSLDFGPLSEVFDTSGASLGIFLPQFYYAIDIANSGGGLPSAGPINVGVAFADGGLGVNGYGDHLVFTFSKTFTNASIFPLTEDDVQDRFTAAEMDAFGAGGQQFDLFAFATDATDPGWLRVYIGFATGDPSLNEPASAVPVTALVPAGTFSGQLTVTVL